MNYKFFNLLIAITFNGFFAFSQEPAPTKSTDNFELAEIYQADQKERTSGNIDWSILNSRDSARRVRVYQLLDSNRVITAKDFYHSAMVFQHGDDTASSSMAVKLMKKAVELDPKINKWLFAAAIDRDLMRRGKPQIYGTQYTKTSEDSPWKLYDIDTTVVTDAERKEYHVEPLNKQRERAVWMNKKAFSTLYDSLQTVQAVVKACKREFKNGLNSKYNLSESEINNFGYELMFKNKNEEALAIFQMNTQFYPNAFNTHDSLGECYLKMGNKKEGIKAYKRSLELNPENTRAKNIIEQYNK